MKTKIQKGKQSPDTDFRTSEKLRHDALKAFGHQVANTLQDIWNRERTPRVCPRWGSPSMRTSGKIHIRKNLSLKVTEIYHFSQEPVRKISSLKS